MSNKKIKIDRDRINKKNIKSKELVVTTLLPADIEFSDDININRFLSKKSEEILLTFGDSRIKIGKIFQEVADRLSGCNQHDGTYMKWLSYIGMNKMTALRYRNRYNLYMSVESESAKKLISIIGDHVIKTILKHDDKDKILKDMDDGIKRKDLMDFLKSGKILLQGNQDGPDFVSDYKKISSMMKSVDADLVPDDKKEKIHSLLSEVKDILSSVTK